MDYAILELETDPGVSYGWTKLSTELPNFDDLLTIIQHPGGRPKELEAGEFYGVDISRTYMFYKDLDTEGGSSGAGVLNADGKLVGVHVGGRCDTAAEDNVGVTLEAIATESPIIQDIIATQNLRVRACSWSYSYSSGRGGTGGLWGVEAYGERCTAARQGEIFSRRTGPRSGYTFTCQVISLPLDSAGNIPSAFSRCE